jgi:hypothetical protein
MYDTRRPTVDPLTGGTAACLKMVTDLSVRRNCLQTGEAPLTCHTSQRGLADVAAEETSARARKDDVHHAKG